MEKIRVKEYKTEDGRLILVLCDSDLIGKKFESKEFIVDLTSPFFAGDKRERAEIIDLLDRAYMLTAIGKYSVELVVSCGIVNEKEKIEINGIPYIQAISI